MQKKITRKKSKKEPIFRNISGIPQVVYPKDESGSRDSYDPITVKPDGIVKGEQFGEYSEKGYPFRLEREKTG